HSTLRHVISRVRFGQQLWREVDDQSEDETNDFLGFGQSECQPSRDSTVVSEKSFEKTRRIQELLRNQWEERIRALNQSAAVAIATKSIVRKARFEINKQTIEKIRKTAHQSSRDSSPAAAAPARDSTQRSGQPGSITCAICAQTKFYSHVQRRYGVFSCESCSKFFAKFLKQPKQYFCAQNGDCPLGAAEWRSSSARCRGCWLKVCLQKFRVARDVRNSVCLEFAPKLLAPPNVALITVDTGAAQPGHPDAAPGLLMVARSSGPRVKRVCRTAGTARCLPRATKRDLTHSTTTDDDIDVYLCLKSCPSRDCNKNMISTMSRQLATDSAFCAKLKLQSDVRSKHFSLLISRLDLFDDSIIAENAIFWSQICLKNLSKETHFANCARLLSALLNTVSCRHSCRHVSSQLAAIVVPATDVLLASNRDPIVVARLLLLFIRDFSSNLIPKRLPIEAFVLNNALKTESRSQQLIFSQLFGKLFLLSQNRTKIHGKYFELCLEKSREKNNNFWPLALIALLTAPKTVVRVPAAAVLSLASDLALDDCFAETAFQVLEALLIT
ncbi:unnamed protein product, partial [Medioppia subpectinata]